MSAPQPPAEHDEPLVDLDVFEQAGRLLVAAVDTPPDGSEDSPN